MAYICNKCGCSAMADEGKKLRCLNCGHTQLKAASQQSSRCTHDLSAPARQTPTAPNYDGAANATPPKDPYNRVLPEDYGQHAPQMVTPQEDTARQSGTVPPPPPPTGGPTPGSGFTPPPFVPRQKKSHVGTVVLIVAIVIVALVVLSVVIATFAGFENDFDFDDDSYGYDDYGYDDYDYDDDYTYYGYQQDDDMPWLYADKDGWVVFSEEDYIGDGTVTVPETVAGIPVTCLDEDAFDDCDTITEVFLPDCMGAIFSYAFDDCDNLRVIHLPRDLDYLYPDVISDCPALEQVIYPGTQEEWDNWVSVSRHNQELFDTLVFAEE